MTALLHFPGRFVGADMMNGRVYSRPDMKNFAGISDKGTCALVTSTIVLWIVIDGGCRLILRVNTEQKKLYQ
jgi:hypothetical protein